MSRCNRAIFFSYCEWWVGLIDVNPGVNCHGRTREKILDNLRSAIQEGVRDKFLGVGACRRQAPTVTVGEKPRNLSRTLQEALEIHFFAPF